MKRDPDARHVHIRYISGGELARYFDAKNIKSECLRCGETSWSLHDTRYARGTSAFLVGSDGIPTPDGSAGFIPQVSLSCNNCGTMWSMSRGYVQAWLDANPRQEEGADETEDK